MRYVEKMYSYILYCSFSKSKVSNAELKELLKKSVEWNSRESITGLLIYRFNKEFNRGNFLQIIEGPKRSIDNVWPRIINDNRHHTVTILEEGSYDQRNFSNWSMGFKNLKDKDLAIHYFMQGEFLLNQGNYALAVLEFQDALEIDPNSNF